MQAIKRLMGRQDSPVPTPLENSTANSVTKAAEATLANIESAPFQEKTVHQLARLVEQNRTNATVCEVFACYLARFPDKHVSFSLEGLHYEGDLEAVKAQMRANRDAGKFNESWEPT